MLFFPFLTLVESRGYFIIYHSSPNITILEAIISLWNFLAIFWCVPYGILVFYLLIWSRKKTVEQIQNTFNATPFMLMVLACGIYLLLALYMFIWGKDSLYNIKHVGTSTFLIMALISVPASLGIGATFVEISFLIYRIFKRFGLIND